MPGFDKPDLDGVVTGVLTMILPPEKYSDKLVDEIVEAIEERIEEMIDEDLATFSESTDFTEAVERSLGATMSDVDQRIEAALDDFNRDLPNVMLVKILQRGFFGRLKWLLTGR